MENILNNLLDKSVNIGFKLIILVIILIVGFKIIKIIMNLLSKGKGFNKLDKSAQSFIKSFINIALKIILFMTALSYLGVPMTSMLALIGSCGLALGLALQGGLSNIAGGLMILIFKPFKVGDYIDNHTDAGTVEDISIFHTTLITPDNRTIVIPNGALSNSTVVNYNGKDLRRLDLNFEVDYNSNIKKVKKIIEKVLDEQELIIKDSERFIRLTNQGESSLTFTIRVWVKAEDYWTVNFDLLEQMKEEFDKNKIEIPYRKLDVNVKQG